MNMSNNKTRFIIQITIALIAIIVLAFATIGVLRFIASPATQPPGDDKAATNARGNNEYTKANDLLKKGDTTGAKQAFENARELYKQTNDTRRLKDINTSLSLLQNTDIPKGPTNEPPLATP